ncbi:MAG: cysteine desulfurase-like protein [Synergistales bacterium]|nr:cysteine desulfurase-like protein [Synergistales bacterium]
MAKLQEQYRDIVERRADFPSLERSYNGHQLAYLDGPGGTQTPRQVVDAVVWYYQTCNSNTHGFNITTNETDVVIEEARKAMADMLGAAGPQDISIGANMTSLAFALSRAFERIFQPGDEVLVTQLDHEANRGPWLTLRDSGVIVREVALGPDGTLDEEDMRTKVTERTRLMCMGLSANTIGTVNNVELARELTYKVGAWLLVDAVHYAPHFPIDVLDMGVDFLLCSAYKFYGPHVGILYSKEGTLGRLPVDRLRTQEQCFPFCIETGTLNHEGIAGVKATVDYIAGMGTGATRREQVVSAMERIFCYEHELAKTLYSGLATIPGLTLVGPTFDTKRRTPTVSFTLDSFDPIDVCKHLNEKGILAWDGHFYGIRPMEVLGLLDQGGVTRLGISLYNTEEEVQRTIAAVKELVS